MATSISKNIGTTIAATLGFEAFIATTKIIVYRNIKSLFSLKMFCLYQFRTTKPTEFPHKRKEIKTITIELPSITAFI